MGPTLPASYGHSEMDYVGSAVAPRQASVDVEAGEGGGAEETTAITAAAAPGQALGGGGPAVSGSTRSIRGAIVLPDQGGQPQEGSIVVQPASAPSYVVVPREYSLGGGIDEERPGTGGEGSAGSLTRESASSSARASTTEGLPDDVARATDTPEEKEEIVAEAAQERRGSQKGFSDGRGGVVFGGNTEEFREAEAEAAAVAGARNGAAVTGGEGPRL